MYTNSVFTGSKLLDRIQKVAKMKYGTEYEDIGLITPHARDGEPYFIINDNAMDKICTVTKNEIKRAIREGKID